MSSARATVATARSRASSGPSPFPSLVSGASKFSIVLYFQGPTKASHSRPTPAAPQPATRVSPMLTLYNTLGRTKQEFHPLRAAEVRMYVCGMTVYDYCHIGHARFMMAFDVVYRWLRASGYKVTYVRNITDIDDKII